MIEEKVLRNVLRQVEKNDFPTAAPDDEYISALHTIGIIKSGWDRELTEMGVGILRYLENKIESEKK